MEVGILGGAFDPITKGHIELAIEAMRVANLDAIWIMPCYKHLYDKHMTSFELRYEMCQIACKGQNHLYVSDFEELHNSTGSMDETITRLMEHFVNSARYSLIIGMDNANTIDLWKNYQHLISIVRFLIVPREGVKKLPLVDQLFKDPHLILDCKVLKTSSTEVRQCISNYDHEKAKELLPPNVWDFINEMKLYRGDYV